MHLFFNFREIALTGFLLFSPVSKALVPAPTDPEHPGSKVYSYSFKEDKIQCAGRDVNVFIPKIKASNESVPVVIFGHGQALGLEQYRGTLEHLAKKGIAVIFPMYDSGFFDQNWTRMGKDYLNLSTCALQRYPELSNEKVIFTGHSKGAYVASVAAGISGKENLAPYPKHIVLFEPAGVDSSTISLVNRNTSLTVVFSDQDTIVKKDISEQIFRQAGSDLRQFVLIKSYPESMGLVKADHFWPLTKASFAGGGSEGPLHYYGSWKWLVAAAYDLNSGVMNTNPYLFGAETTNKGVRGLSDDLIRN